MFPGVHYPVFHFVNRIKHIQGSLVMSHHDHSGTMFASHIAKELHDLTPPMAVQSGCGFVREEDAGMIGQCPSHSDSLLLSAGKHCRAVIEPISHTELIQKFGRSPSRFSGSQAVQFHGNLDILNRCQKRNQVRLLKHKTDVLTPERLGDSLWRQNRPVPQLRRCKPVRRSAD